MHKGTITQQSGFRLFPGSHLWTGTTGNVVKIWLLASSSTATPVNIPPSGAVQRTDPTKSDVSVLVNISSMYRTGIVMLTHHKLRQPQDIGSKTTSEYSIW